MDDNILSTMTVIVVVMDEVSIIIKYNKSYLTK